MSQWAGVNALEVRQLPRSPNSAEPPAKRGRVPSLSVAAIQLVELASPEAN